MPELRREALFAARPRRGSRLAFGLLAAFAVTFGLVALILPALLTASLLVRGISEGYPSWILLGGLAGALWTLLLVVTLRRASGRAKPPPADDPPPSAPARG